MTYDLLIAGGFDRAVLANALADLAGVAVGAVDVADRDTEDRAWDSPALCTYEPAVAKRIPAFPSARVEPLPEVIREHQVPTPVADELTNWLAGDEVVLLEGTHDSVRQAHIWLTVWEQITQRMAAGWPSDGWYPADFYRDDLTARDRLGTALPHLPATVTGRFRRATGRIDEQFKALTHETTTHPTPTKTHGGGSEFHRTPA